MAAMQRCGDEGLPATSGRRGGLPAAAFGGRTEVMERLAPLGPVYQAGTLSGNPVAVAAGLAAGRIAADPVRDHCAAVSVGMIAGVPTLDLAYDQAELRARTVRRVRAAVGDRVADAHGVR